jgi:hypothetical protein
MCTGKSYTLPSRRITLRGAPGAGFDGTGAPSNLLKGTDVSTTVIKDLIFRDARGPWDGNAIIIDGSNSAPRILNSTFRNNGVSNGSGGAITVIQGPTATGAVVLADNTFGGTRAAQGNIGGYGAAAYITADHDVRISGNVFRNNSAANSGGALYLTVRGSLDIANNTFVNNVATSDGGAAYVYPTQNATLVRNLFDGNRLEGGSPFSRRGGGLFLFIDTGPGSVELQQRNNVFSHNRVGAASNASGGGQYVLNIGAAEIVSRDDRYIQNRINGDGVGGGLSLATANLSGEVHASLLDTVLAGNSITGLGSGGGLNNDLNCISSCFMDIALRNATIAGNKIGSGNGSQSYMQAGLIASNSIIFGNGSANDNTAVGSVAISDTDVCAAGGAPAPGAGNICKNPRLKNATDGDVHQTRRSPTDDKGSNALVPSSLKTDFEGHRRILNSDSKAGARVDMGADELRPRARIGVVIGRGSVLVSGAVKPKNARKRVVVTLYRKKNGRFRKLATRRDRLNRRSRYAVRFGDPAPGRCRVKVAFLGSATTSPGAKTKKFSC